MRAPRLGPPPPADPLRLVLKCVAPAAANWLLSRPLFRRHRYSMPTAPASEAAQPVQRASTSTNASTDPVPDAGKANAPSVGNTSFKSHWRDNPSAKRDAVIWLIDFLDAWPLPNEHPAVPTGAPVPYLSPLTFFRWSFLRTFIPIALQWGFSYLLNDVIYAGQTSPWPLAGWGPWFAGVWYVLWYYLIGVDTIRSCRELGARYGFFDSSVPRDEIPDAMRGRVAASVLLTVVQRTFMEITTAYDTNAKPSVRWQLPIQMAVYTWTLDFYYYWYHRVMHESNTLWPYHRTHHLSRHPNTFLTLFADDEQELFDMVGIPFLTYLTMCCFDFLKPNFYEWWCCNIMVTVVELVGHAGVRMYFTASQAFPFLLQRFDMDIALEDHDIHHRRGWKGSGNYGKQTRIWDKIFGTVLPRDEGPNTNIDKNLPVVMPWW